MTKYKINYHLTEHCNFNCKFCFAKYEKEKKALDEQKKAIERIAECSLFDSLNFAGGEPLLDANISTLIKFAYEKGLKVSIITNGYFLSDKLLKEISPYLSMIGISVHSFNDYTKREIGSCTNTGHTLTNDKLIHICSEIKRLNPYCLLKINSVICAKNKDEVLHNGIASLCKVDKWKCLKCQEFLDNEDMLVTKKEYERFIENNKTSCIKQVFEEDMKSSYIMMNPSLELIRPSENGYETIGSFLNDDICKMIEKLNLDNEEYQRRYK